MTPVLVDLYVRRFGPAALVQNGGAKCNGPCPFCGGKDRFAIFIDDKHLGKVCAEHGIEGFFHCFRCERSGDTLQYLMDVDGLDFKEALSELGIAHEPTKHRRQRHPYTENQSATVFSGRASKAQKDVWIEHVSRMNSAAVEALPSHRSAVLWLDGRGITPTMSARYGLGFIDGENGRDCRFRLLSSFGLEEYEGSQGKTVRHIRIPRGITIPTSDAAGRVTMWRVRRPNHDVRTLANGKKEQKYWELKGGSGASFHLRPTGDSPVLVYTVVEAELDAILLHAMAGEGIGVIGTRACTNRPDEAAHAELSRADLILIMLDGDDAGRKACAWWLQTYPSSARVCTLPGFKDPGDAFRGGFSIRTWLEAVMPCSVSLPAPTCGPRLSTSDESSSCLLAHQGGFVDGFAPASFSVGDGGNPDGEDTKREEITPISRDEYADILTTDMLAALRSSLPAWMDIGGVPSDVLVLSVLWRGALLSFHKDTGGGFEWRINRPWAKRHPDEYERFIRLATSSADIADWLSVHSATDINSSNFLRLF